MDEGVDGPVADEVAGGAVASPGGGARFWQQIAKGLTSEEAAAAVGVSQAVGGRWFRHGGGMPPIDLAPVSGRYLSFAEREEIALLRAQGAGVRAIARQLGRAPSTISRELRRNAATRGGKLDYRASVAQWKAELVARRPKTAKLVDQRAAARLRAGTAGRASSARPDGDIGGRAGDAGVEGAEQAAPQGSPLGRWRGARSRSRSG